MTRNERIQKECEVILAVLSDYEPHSSEELRGAIRAAGTNNVKRRVEALISGGYDIGVTKVYSMQHRYSGLNHYKLTKK